MPYSKKEDGNENGKDTTDLQQNSITLYHIDNNEVIMKLIRKIINWRRKSICKTMPPEKPRYIPLSYENNFDNDEQVGDKYEINHRGFGFRDSIPFEPTTDEVIYIEDEYDEKTNHCIRENIDFIRECFAKRGFVFVYLPLLGEELKDNADIWRYKYPFADKVGKFDVQPISSNYLLDFMVHPENRYMIRPCFARFNYCEDKVRMSVGKKTQVQERTYAFDTFDIDLEGVEDLHDYFDFLSRSVSGELGFWMGLCKLANIEYEDADDAFDDETKKMLKDVKYKIELLRRKGISEVVLKSLVEEKPRLSKLVITKDYRILLPDYKGMEISMEPLVKSVFLLFLKHPDGIVFKCLPDYREELSDIYNKVRGKDTQRDTSEVMEYSKNIINVTDPLNNSINEKCTRIKEAFLLKFHESLAENYFITGKRGEPKRIRLPEELIVWEK